MRPRGAERDVHGGKLPQTKAGVWWRGVCVLGEGVLVMIEPKARRSRRVVRRKHTVLKEGLANVVDTRAWSAPEIDNVAHVELTSLAANAGTAERMLDHRVAVVVTPGPRAAPNTMMNMAMQMTTKLRARVRPELAEGRFLEVRPPREALRRPPRGQVVWEATVAALLASDAIAERALHRFAQDGVDRSVHRCAAAILPPRTLTDARSKPCAFTRLLVGTVSLRPPGVTVDEPEKEDKIEVTRGLEQELPQIGQAFVTLVEWASCQGVEVALRVA